MALSSIVLSGGERAHPAVRHHLCAGALVIAADSGYGDAASLGLNVDLLVGDLDSIDHRDLAEAVDRGVPIERHPPDKDATDLELALVAARRSGAARVTVVSGGGGRLDHLVGGLALLGSAQHADLELDAWIGTAYVRVIHGPGSARIAGRRGEVLSLLALGGDATGIVTQGLRFALHGETLRPGETRGISNEISDSHAQVTVESGTVLVIRPDALGPDAPGPDAPGPDALGPK